MVRSIVSTLVAIAAILGLFMGSINMMIFINCLKPPVRKQVVDKIADKYPAIPRKELEKQYVRNNIGFLLMAILMFGGAVFFVVFGATWIPANL